MAERKGKIDTYANIAAIFIAETVAGTPAYAKFAFPFSIMDKMALLISRVEYWYGSIGQLNTSGDTLYAGLSTSSSVVDLTNQSDPVIVDSTRLLRVDLGAAASGTIVQQPYVKDFSNLPGGGILVAPAPLYAFVNAVGAGGVVSCWVRLYYTYMELSTDDYWQLVESRRIISS